MSKLTIGLFVKGLNLLKLVFLHTFVYVYPSCYCKCNTFLLLVTRVYCYTCWLNNTRQITYFGTKLANSKFMLMHKLKNILAYANKYTHTYIYIFHIYVKHVMCNSRTQTYVSIYVKAWQQLFYPTVIFSQTEKYIAIFLISSLHFYSLCNEENSLVSQSICIVLLSFVSYKPKV